MKTPLLRSLSLLILVPSLLGGSALAQTLKPSQLVTLIADDSTPVCPNTSVPHTFSDRLLPDGSRKPFKIPAGQAFVITSFDWVIEGSSQANGNVWTGVTLIGAGKNNALYSSAAADSIGRASGHTDVPNGVVVFPNTAMCLDYVGGATDSFATIHGYLTIYQ